MGSSCSTNTAQEQANFAWDEKCDWFYIRCLKDDRDYIMNEYLKAQSEMEDELKEQDVIRDDGSLIPNVENNLVGPLRSRVAVPDESGESQEADSTENANIRYPKGHGSIKKPEERQAESETKAYQF